MEPTITETIDTIRNIYIAEAKGKIKYKSVIPATAARIKAFEKKLGEPLPEDYIEFLKHNDLAMCFNYGYIALSVEEVAAEWSLMKKQLDKGVFDDGRVEANIRKKVGNWESGYLKKVWWSPKWVPFAKNDKGSMKCIDLDPGKKGDKGQIITMAAGVDEAGPFGTDFWSFRSYLSEQAYFYEEKQYDVEAGKNGSVHISLDTFASEIKKKIALIRDTYISRAKGEVKYRSLKKATDAKIRAFEARLGVSLPEAYTVFLKNNDVAMAFDGGFEAMPLDKVIRTWSVMNKHLDKGVFDDGRIERHEKEGFGNWKGDYVKKVWWSKKWVPFAEDSCGNTKCIDLDPGKNGEEGQITAMEVQDGQGPFATKYLSFSSYLDDQVSFYKNNKYEVEESWDGSALISVDSYM